MSDLLFWCVMGFCVNLDKVIFLHDTFPCQSLFVFISETLDDQTKRNISIIPLALSFLNPTMQGLK